MHPPHSRGLSEVGWVGEGKGNQTCAEQGEEGEGGRVVAMPGQMPMGKGGGTKQKGPQGRRKGRRFLGDGPSGQQGWAQGGAGWREEGLELRRMM